MTHASRIDNDHQFSDKLVVQTYTQNTHTYTCTTCDQGNPRVVSSEGREVKIERGGASDTSHIFSPFLPCNR